MATSEEVFIKDFKNMQKNLKAINYGMNDLNSIPLPPDFHGEIEFMQKVCICDVDDQYYGKLNNTEAYLITKGNLQRRITDFKGEFKHDKNGNTVYEHVSVPQNCAAIVSKYSIGVPALYKRDGFSFVDYIEKDGSYRFIYLIPKVHLHKMNMIALEVSFKSRTSNKYYLGYEVALRNGGTLRLYVTPYKPKPREKLMSNTERILACSTDPSLFSKEIASILNYWVSTGYMWNPNDCKLTEYTIDRENMAIYPMPNGLEEYVRVDLEHSLASTDVDLWSNDEENIGGTLND